MEGPRLLSHPVGDRHGHHAVALLVGQRPEDVVIPEMHLAAVDQLLAFDPAEQKLLAVAELQFDVPGPCDAPVDDAALLQGP